MKKKILMITVFVLSLFSFSNVFAFSKSEFDAILNEYSLYTSFIGTPAYEEALTLIEQYEYGYVSVGSNSTYNFYVWLSNEEAIYNPSKNGIYLENGGLQLRIELYSGKWYLYDQSISAGAHIYSVSSLYRYYGGGVINSSTLDYHISPGTETSPVINITPPPGEGDSSEDFQVTLPAIVQESHPERVLVEVVTLIPIVIVCLISWIGLRKALQLLSNLLHNS